MNDMLRLWIPLDRINDLQITSIRRLIARAKGAHMTDIDMRINGQNERHEADWLKHMREQINPDAEAGRRELANMLDEIARGLTYDNEREGLAKHKLRGLVSRLGGTALPARSVAG